MPSPTKSNLPADQRRAVTVDAVVALSARQNPSDITTAAIAEHMGLTQGALFRHFRGKDEIWEAVMRWVAGRLLALVDHAAGSATSPGAALEAAFLAHIDFVARHPGVPRILFGELQHSRDTAAKRAVRALLAEYRQRIGRWIEAGKSGGEFDPRLDVGDAATMFIGTVQGLVMQSLLEADPRRLRATAPGAFALYRRGLGGAVNPAVRRAVRSPR